MHDGGVLKTWNGPGMQELRRKHRDGDFTAPACAKCIEWSWWTPTVWHSKGTAPKVEAHAQAAPLRHFGSIKRVREASVEDLASVPGMTRSAAEAVFAHWAKQPVAETVSRDAPVTTENEAGKQAEELAIDDAFAAVEADQVPLIAT